MSRKYTIEDMHALARERGGKCLSTVFLTVVKKLRWRCSQGHEWEATPASVKQGCWCPVCKSKKMTKHTIEDMQVLAENHGGKCLSKSFKTVTRKLRWRCNKGHEWNATPASIKQGSWCPGCRKAHRKYTIEDMQALAKKRGGECISVAFLSINKKLRWRCGERHEWEATPNNIKHGQWCPECAKKKIKNVHRKYTIEDMQTLAKKRGGECLSETFQSIAKKLKWRCSEGHEWEACLSSVKQDSWCPECGKQKIGSANRKYTIVDMQNLARARGGECISETYQSKAKKLKWRCSEGHEWDTTPDCIKKGTWCPECAKKKAKRFFTIDEIQTIAKERGGKCLSYTFHSASDKLEWCCKEGHEWRAMLYSVKKGSWCPECTIQKLTSNNRKFTIEDMNTLAEERGGACISGAFLSVSKKLRWRCREGHEWEATPNNIKQGQWCPECAKKKIGDANRKYTIEDMQALAKDQGGECLSETFQSVAKKLRWRCSEGHEWDTTPTSIQQGSWCPICRGRKPKLGNLAETDKTMH